MASKITAIQSSSSRGSKSRRNWGSYLAYLILFAGIFMTLMPFIWMILGSFKTALELIQVPPTFWPANPTLENYRTILTDPKLPITRFYANSAFVAVFNVAATLFTSSLLGFLFAKYDFRGKNLLFGWILLSMMIPLTARC